MIDISRQRPVLRPYQCGSAEEVLHLRPWSQDGWSSIRLALLFITSIYILDRCQPIEPHVVHESFFFLSYSLDYHFETQVGTLWCIGMLSQESLMSFRLIGLSSHSCYHLITTQKVLFYTFKSLCFKHFCVVILHLYSNWHVKDLEMTPNHICGQFKCF